MVACMEYGTLAWARSTKGHLVGFARLQQLWQAARFRMRRAQVRPEGLVRDADFQRALGEAHLPETPLVAAAYAHVAAHASPALTAHVMRTHIWGSLLGKRDGLRWDFELFALAALLHDVALARRDHSHTCFAHDGAEQSLALLTSLGMEEARRMAVADAVCLHLRVEVPVSLGVEAHLVHAGAALDVVGTRRTEIPSDIERAVLQAHPRGPLVEELVTHFEAERRAHPTARISRWVDSGFLTLVRKNPLGHFGHP